MDGSLLIQVTTYGSHPVRATNTTIMRKNPHKTAANDAIGENGNMLITNTASVPDPILINDIALEALALSGSALEAK